MKRVLVILLIIISFMSCEKKSKIETDLIKIGCIKQLSVQMAKYGKTQVAAVTAMKEIYNQKRKAEGFPLYEILVDDDQLKPTVGVSIIKKFIQLDGVKAVIGAQGSSVTLAMAPIAEKNKVVLISGASGSPKISGAGDYIFRTCPSDLYEGQAMADYFNQKLAGKSLGILYINNDYGVGLKKVFLSNLNTTPPIMLDLAFNQGALDFRNQLTKIKSNNIDVIYLVGYNEMINIYKQAKELGIKSIWLGNNQLNDQSLIDKMGMTANGTIFPGHHFDLEFVKKNNSDFYNKYIVLSNGVELDVFAAYAADAFILINHAVVNGAKTGTDIKDHLYNLKGFKGLLGELSFDKNGDAIRSLGLNQIVNGKIVKYNH